LPFWKVAFLWKRRSESLGIKKDFKSFLELPIVDKYLIFVIVFQAVGNPVHKDICYIYSQLTRYGNNEFGFYIGDYVLRNFCFRFGSGFIWCFAKNCGANKRAAIATGGCFS